MARTPTTAAAQQPKARPQSAPALSDGRTGRRVDLYACVLQLFMILALVPIAGTIADTIMTNVFAERRHYQDVHHHVGEL